MLRHADRERMKTSSAAACHDYPAHVASLAREVGVIMRVLVTGGAGFIGSNFVRRTLETRKGVEISVLDSLTYAGSRDNLAPCEGEFSFIRGDIRDAELVSDLVSGSDVVVHFAAESHNDNSLTGPDIFFESNVLGTLQLVKACVTHGVRFHHISTDEVFGDLALDSEEEFGHETPYSPSSPYSASKAASDHVVRAWVRSYGLMATISNCSNNYGNFQHWEKLIPATISRIAEGKKPKVYGSGLNIRDWIHVDDHTDGIWRILDDGKHGETYLLGARDRLTNLEVVQSILKVMGKSSDWIEFVKDRPGHDRKYAVNPTKILDELSWIPEQTSLISAIPNLVDHYSKRIPAI